MSYLLDTHSHSSDDDHYHSDDGHIDYSNSPISFPQKLFILLEENGSDVIEWAPNGLCFRIKDTERFCAETMPKYFKQSKLTSFQRQLNLYGFRRIARGEDTGCYFHPRFHRGRRDCFKEIKRLPPKGSLMNYEQVLAAHNVKRQTIVPALQHLVCNPSYNYQQPYVVTSCNPAYCISYDNQIYSNSDDVCDSSISTASSFSNNGCDSPIPLEFKDDEIEIDIDFFNLFAADLDDLDSSRCMTSLEQRDYIPTYEEAVWSGLISE